MTRLELQSTVEQLEGSNEEFRVTNEELQSTNEELETSKEELQSVNEELSTVNHQLSLKLNDLENKHADLENLVTATEVPTICVDTELAIRWFTPAAAAIMRLRAGDIGRPLSDIAHDFVENDLLDSARRVLETLELIETEVACHDGRNFLRRMMPYRIDSHRVGGVVITHVDITHQKKQELALREVTEQLAAELSDMKRLDDVSTMLLRSGSLQPLAEEILEAAIVITRSDMGIMQLLTPGTQELRVFSQRGFDKDHLDFLDRVDDYRMSADGAVYESGWRVLISDVEANDSLRPESVQAHLKAGIHAVQSTPLTSRNGQLLGMISTYWRKTHEFNQRSFHRLDRLARQAGDLIGRSLVEAELRNARLDAEIANRAKNDFLANISHEIRTPMGAILGVTELLLGTQLTDAQRQDMEIVQTASESLLGLLNEILDFSKIEASKLELDVGDFSLNGMLDDVVGALGALTCKKGLQLNCEVRPGVPDSLVGDANRLRRVLLNLVGNAVKFTEKGSVSLGVEIVDRPTPPDHIALCFVVRDTGIGIPANRMQSMFQPFEQADNSTTRRYGGTGLGLTIASQLVALMGGTIAVDSAPGRGSTFSFDLTLPLQTRDPAAIRSPPPEPLAAESQLRILVAEDSEPIALLMRRVLTNRGHQVSAANDGHEALAALGILPRSGAASPQLNDDEPSDAPFDLMFLDLQMPQFDGFEVVKAIRNWECSAGGHLPVIALTAHFQESDRQRCVAAGMDDFVSKPFKSADLFTAIERVSVDKNRR